MKNIHVNITQHQQQRYSNEEEKLKTIYITIPNTLFLPLSKIGTSEHQMYSLEVRKQASNNEDMLLQQGPWSRMEREIRSASQGHFISLLTDPRGHAMIAR
ncbi:hypothetical protein E2C01_093872 [Portunus trituberculatus]|uniref:Uncharacterized protein n=1 Tax=Portunus trituberculatus TaxID=210409 RepID=A0A5B7JUN0_PORTR|nr:hypothetical protein [Portunus trituberculatus]